PWSSPTTLAARSTRRCTTSTWAARRHLQSPGRVGSSSASVPNAPTRRSRTPPNKRARTAGPATVQARARDDHGDRRPAVAVGLDAVPAAATPASQPGGLWLRLGSVYRKVPVHGQANGKHRAAAGVVARVNVSAVKACVLPGDRQAQAAALRTGPRGIGLVEPVEQVRDRGGGQPIAVVAHVHGQPGAAFAVWLEASRHSHWEGAMTHGIADEVGKDNVEAAAVQPHGQPGGHVSGYVRPAPRAKAPADDGRDVGVIGHKLRGTRIEAGDLDEVLDQPVEVEHLLADQPRG